MKTLHTPPRLVREVSDAGQGISLAQAGRAVRPSRPISTATAWRWCTRGVRRCDGVVFRLESLRAGRPVLTSAEAVGRFLAALNQQPQDVPQASPQPRPAAARVGALLDAANI